MSNPTYQGPPPEKIQSMFATVARGYDRANQILSMGIHHLWRSQLVKIAAPTPHQSILDCATGTGDLAIALQARTRNTAKVVGIDFCAEMLDFAPKKATDQNLSIDFKVADVTRLPFPDETFDTVTISFGIRNVQDPQKALQEMARVLKKNGRLLVLEFGQPQLPIFREIYTYYSENILPRIGGAITGDTQAYKYLQNSSARFPCRDSFLNWMEMTGQLTDLQYKTLTGGIAYIYVGKKKS